MSKLFFIKDQDDLEIELSKDKIINIIGLKGSGKTTSTLKYIEDDNYIVINTDRLFDLYENKKTDKEIENIKKYLLKEYKSIDINTDFRKYYDSIIKYSLSKEKIPIIEGNALRDMDTKYLKGKIIVKRTGVLKCYLRAVKRDYKNEYFMNEEKKKHKYFYKITRLINISKRRKKIFKEAFEIEELIDKFSKVM